MTAVLIKNCYGKSVSEKRKNMKTAAIVLAAGKGSRMKADCPKQYLLLKEKPILYYSLKAFEESCIDEVVLVVGKGEIEYCWKEIVEKYQFKKVTVITEGGKERYHSVYEGLKQMKNVDYVFIHDGARPFVTSQLIAKLLEEVKKYKACVAGMPVKDTIKLVDDRQFVTGTPDRRYVWLVQTPQVFDYNLVCGAYKMLMEGEQNGITDDAMVVEQMTGHPVKLIEADYQNIKITTPEDIMIGENFLK